MSEADAVAQVEHPLTRASLRRDLRRLGVRPSMILLVHTAMSKLGWVNGGPVALIQALQDALTLEGTLIMPAHSGDLSDPRGWRNPPIPKAWHQLVRDTMPAYDPGLTPTRAIGRVPELFRTWPDVRRSGHPNVSFAAWGRYAQFVTADHELDNSLGEDSPLAVIYQLDGYVLLLGAEYDSNTSFHLAEYRAGRSKLIEQGAPIMRDGRRMWVAYRDIDFDDDLFPSMGAALDQTGAVITGKIGAATCRLFRQRAAVDFAVNWLRNQ